MIKKLFNIFIIISVIMTFVPITANALVFVDEYEKLESPAVTYNLNVDWKYKRAADDAVFPLATALDGVAKDGKNFYDTDYDDSDWETVSIPHAVNAADSFDGLGIDAGEASLYRGFMFYRKSITVPQTDAGKKFIIEFEAFRQSVYVYVNGEMAGYYEAGVAPVGFDLTDYIVAGQKNVIAVATDNMSARGVSGDFAWSGGTVETIPGNEPGDLSGYSYQWNTKDYNPVQGGLTGNVKLHAKSKIYQTLPLYSNMKTTGNYIYASNFNLREKSADVTVEAEVRNETGENKNITLHVDIVDGNGELVKSFETTSDVAAATDTEDDQFLTVVPDDAYELETNESDIENEKNDVNTDTVQVTKITATASIDNLYFWSDENPYLYTIYTYLKDGDTVIDMQKTVTGFREVTYDKDRGLLINNEPTYLKGYVQNSTSEWAAIGVGNDWLSDIDMELVKESNANFIRWRGVAPNPADIRSGDKYGVVSVVPAGDKEADQGGRFWDMRLEAMRDVIIYYRNSPSVVFYEAGNNAITAEHMQRMTDLRKELDPSNYRLMGCRSISTAEQIEAAEWVGTMLYRHGDTAYNVMGETGNYKPILELEYHRNESPRRVWDDFSPPYYDYVNKWLGSAGTKQDGYDIWDQTQEDFSRTMLNSGDGYSYFYNNRVYGSGKNEYSGAAMMFWSDSNMHNRNGASENARTSGKVDPVRIKKESFYAIKAAQSATPEVHILGHWNYPEYIEGDTENGNYWVEQKLFNDLYWEPNGTFSQRNPTEKTVYVVGSEDIEKVELYVNDELVGTDTTPIDNFIYAFDGIDVTQSGKVTAKAYNEREEVIAEHEIKTAGEAAKIRLTPVTGPDGFKADGSDIMYLDVEIVDAEGNVCPLEERKITFKVSNESKAKFLGGYNSGYYGDGLDGAGERIVNHKDYVFAECGVNRVFLQSTRDAGEFTVTATADGVSPAYITFESFGVETTGGMISDEEIKYVHQDSGVDKVYKYDTVASFNDCNEAIGTAILSEDTSPDGTKYLTASDEDICFPGLDANSTADLMWEADVRFNEEGSSIIPRDEDDKYYGTCVLRNDGDGTPKLSIQTGGSSYTRYVEIDPTAWYHIALVGRYSPYDSEMDMFVYEYDENGERVFIDKYEDIYARGLSIKNGASHWNAGGGISVDNAKITVLGADSLEVSSDTDTINLESTMQLYCNATRQGQYVETPEITWEIYNANNTEPLADENITITEDGTLNVGLGASSQEIYVRATAQSGISAYKRIYIGEIKFDTLTLSAEKSYVSATEPLTITPAATKDGQVVELTDSDLIWYVTDSTDTMKLGDNLKWIKIENGVLTVDSKAVTQDITICASDPLGYVKSSILVHIKAIDALEVDESGNGDKIHFSSNCESELEGTEFVESIDGTHAYRVTEVLKTGNAQTNTEMTIEMDIKFEQEGAGFMPMHNNRVGIPIVYHNGMLAAQTGSSSFVSYCEISPDTWYHITDSISNSYHNLTIEEYDDDGNRINKQEFENVNQRSDNTFSGVRIGAGTVYDNLRVIIPETTADDTIKNSIAISNVNLTDNIVNFTAEISSADEIKGKIITAVYNMDGAVSMIKLYDAQESIDVSFEKKDNDSIVKVFWWDGIDTMLPVAENVTIELSEIEEALENLFLKSRLNTTITQPEEGTPVHLPVEITAIGTNDSDLTEKCEITWSLTGLDEGEEFISLTKEAGTGEGTDGEVPDNSKIAYFNVRNGATDTFGTVTATVKYLDKELSISTPFAVISSTETDNIAPKAGYPVDMNDYSDSLVGYKVTASPLTTQDIILNNWSIYGSNASRTLELKKDDDGTKYLRFDSNNVSGSTVGTYQLPDQQTQYIVDMKVRFTGGKATFGHYGNMLSRGMTPAWEVSYADGKLTFGEQSIEGLNITDWFRVIISADESAGTSYLKVYDNSGNLIGEINNEALLDDASYTQKDFQLYGTYPIDIASFRVYYPTGE